MLLIFIVRNLHVTRKLSLAHFAFKFSKIVMLSPTHNLLLNFYSNPLDEAFVVDGPTRSIAFAWVEQKVAYVVMLLEADLASRSLHSWIICKSEYVLIKVKF
jgi:hypothetical protein